MQRVRWAATHPTDRVYAQFLLILDRSPAKINFRNAKSELGNAHPTDRVYAQLLLILDRSPAKKNRARAAPPIN